MAMERVACTASEVQPSRKRQPIPCVGSEIFHESSVFNAGYRQQLYASEGSTPYKLVMLQYLKSI